MKAIKLNSMFMVMALAAVFFMTACSHNPEQKSKTQIANPASEYCVKKGGTLVIEKDKSGGEVGMCHLPDGTVIEEWELFRASHPGK